MILVSLLLVVLAVLGAPLFTIIATSAMVGFHSNETELMTIALELMSIAQMPILTAIPLFTFAGYLLSESNAPRRLVRLTNALFGWMPGGLALVCLAACAFFTAFTGASGVTIIALGAILYPALKQDGYDDRFNLGLVTSSGSLGLLFAPSLPLILYGVVAEVSIDALFRAGIMPGLLMLIMLSGYSIWVNRDNRKPMSAFSLREVLGALREAVWELPLPIVVLGGIYSGFFAVSEAAAITALYVFVAEVLINREIRLRDLPGVIRESMVLVGGILMILGVSLASTYYMIDSEVPQKLLQLVADFVTTPTSFLVLLLVFLLILGAILDIFSAIVLVVPLILPIAAGFGVNEVHLGIVFLAAMQLGYLTPPVGLNLFIASYRFEKPIMHVYSATFPFLVILMLSVVIITFFPALSLAATDDIELPPGFVIENYADVPRARSLALGDQGTLFVSNRRGRSVYAVVENDDGTTRTIELLDGMHTPNGIAFHDDDLYVAEIDRVYRYADIEDNLDKAPAGELLDIDLPSERHHGWRYIGFGPDDKLYISIGAPCNICDEPGFAQIVRVNPDGSNRETYARGVRNSVGFTWHPQSGELWFTDNGRDMLGDDLPPDELNRAPQQGLHFGYPYCHGGDLPDPKFGKGRNCTDYTPPAQKLGAHVAPLGVKFYTGTMFPPEYKNQVFIAEHGSWNRSKKTGYRISLVRLVGNRAVSYAPFATGWLQQESVSGRPVDLVVKDDGSLLVSDDMAGKIYRISYRGDAQ